VTQRRFYNAYTKRAYPDLTYLEWETHMATAAAEPHFARDLTQKCRSFGWYIEQVNTDLSSILEEPVEVRRVAKEPPKTSEAPKQADKNEAAKANPQHAGEEADGPDLSRPRIQGEIASGEAKKGGPAKPLPDGKRKPKQALCEECLSIVQKAQPIDIAFVDVRDGHKAHPHLGATDENGNMGYVHDETALRKHPPAFHMEEDMLRSQCQTRDNTYRMLNEKVYVDLEYHDKMEKSLLPRDKIFCLVYTIDAFHSKIPAIRETWG
jgi:hypothetical protein